MDTKIEKIAKELLGMAKGIVSGKPSRREITKAIEDAVGNLSPVESTIKLTPYKDYNIISFGVPTVDRKGTKFLTYYATNDSGEPWSDKPKDFRSEREAISWMKKQLDSWD